MQLVANRLDQQKLVDLLLVTHVTMTVPRSIDREDDRHERHPHSTARQPLNGS